MVDIIPNWHPIFVHFTIGLLAAGAVMFVASALVPAHRWSETALKAAHVNLWAGAGIAIATVLAGFYAYDTVAHDGPSHAAMTDHRNWALPTAALWIGLALWSGYAVRKSGWRRGWVFVLLIVSAASALAVTGFKGGEAVYRHGIGVMSLPEIEGQGGHGSHSHDGADRHETGQLPAEGDRQHDIVEPEPATVAPTTVAPAPDTQSHEPHDHDDHNHQD